MTRKIIHVDMDAFYASVEQHDNPELRGKPVVVGGSPNGRGVVAASSYEARKFGVRSAMGSREALRRCADLIFVRPRFDRYREISAQVMSIFHSYTDLVEPLSLDEAYLDVTVNKAELPLAREVARRIKDDIFRTTGLTASAGVAPNKFLAKIASDFRKPDGLTVIPPDRIESFLHPLPVGKIHGVGRKTEERMKELGIFTVGDLLTFSEERLIETFGSSGSWFYRIARGQDDREVQVDRDRKSLGAEETFDRDLDDLDEIRSALDEVVTEVWRRLAKRDITGSTVVLKLTYHNFRKLTRSLSGEKIVDEADLRARAHELLRRTEAGDIPIRLIGVTVSRLTSDAEEDEKPAEAEHASSKVVQLRFPFMGR